MSAKRTRNSSPRALPAVLVVAALGVGVYLANRQASPVPASAAVTALLDAAKASNAAGRPDDVEQILARAETQNPGASELDAIAQLHASAGQPAKAASILRKLADATPKKPQPWISAAEMQARAGLAADADASLARAQALKLDEGQSTQIAGVYLLLKRSEKAQALMEKLASKGSRSPLVWIMLARARGEQGKKTEAKAALARAEALKPADDAAEIAAFTAQQLGDYERADRLFAGLAKAHPQTGKFPADRGVVAALQNKPKEAISFLDDAIRLEPALAGSYLTLASVYAGQNRYDDALRVYDAALARSDLGPLRTVVASSRDELKKTR